MTLAELIDNLERVRDENGDEDIEVRLAHQPSWPFEYSIDRYADWPVVDGVLYIPEGAQIGYLPGEVKAEIGW